MEQSRRCFLLKSGCLVCAPTLTCCSEQEQVKQSRVISLGTIGQLPEGKTVFTRERVALFRRGEQVYALSMVCSHQQCLLQDQGDSLLCPCHGSRFNFKGRPLNGPATKNLTRYPVMVSSEGELTVDLARSVEE